MKHSINPGVRILITLVVFSLVSASIPLPVWIEAAHAVGNGQPALAANWRDAQVSEGLQGLSADGIMQSGGLLSETPFTRDFPTAPTAVANPLALARVQSDYQVGGGLAETILITYTVTNLQLPANPPVVPEGMTPIEVIDWLEGYSLGDDPNTIHNVLVRTSLTGSSNLLDASIPHNRLGSTLAWNLGSLPPQASKLVVIEISASGSETNFVELDGGAGAWGSLGGRMVAAAAFPAILAPASVGDWLKWTVDADYYDEELLRSAAVLGGDPNQMFAYVRSLGYEAYDGSLRGTRGTIWSEAGNSTDLSSLLIALLRSSGIPARYRHGTLSVADAQQLIASMFPEPTIFFGAVPEGAAVSDPINDLDLIAEVRDHWWVEAYLPGGGWTNLDPSFSNAAVGGSYADPLLDGTDRIAELPDDVRHKVTMYLEVEDYHPLNLGFGGLKRTIPLSQTFNTVEVVGKPVTFAHLVESKPSLGLVFSVISHKYTPYLMVGDQEIFGETYQDLLTNFPLGTIFHTGAWLKFIVHEVDGTVDYYERELEDKLGADIRWYGGSPVMATTGNDAMFSDSDIYTTWFWPNLVPQRVLDEAQARSLGVVDEINADLKLLEALYNKPNRTQAEDAQFRAVRARFQANMANFLANIGIAFGELADRNLVESGEGLFVKAYYDAPRIITIAVEPNDGAVEFTIDLRKTGARAIPYPGQAAEAGVTFNIVKGTIESGIEGLVIERNTGGQAITAALIFSKAAEQDITAYMVTLEEISGLDALGISEKGKARIIRALLDGKFVIVPGEAVEINGEEYTGWWELDPDTGETIGVMDNGLHSAFLEYIADIGAIAGAFVDFMLGFTSYTLGFVAYHVDKAIGDGSFDLPGYLTMTGNASRGLACLTGLTGIYAGVSCAGGLDLFGDGQKAAEGYFSRIVTHDPPVPEQLQGLPMRDLSEPVASEMLDVTASYPGGPVAASLETDFMMLSGYGAASWVSVGGQGHPFDGLTISSGSLFDAQGNLLASGAMSASPQTGGNAYVQLGAGAPAVSFEGTMSLYAPSLDGLGAGSHWSAFDGAYASGSAKTLSITGSDVTINNKVFSGNFRVETTGSIAIQGAGSGAAPAFAPDAEIQLDDTSLIFGPGTGSAQIGGTPLDITNGLALAGFTGIMDVEELNATTDAYDLSGDVALFTLALDPYTTVTDPVTPVDFQVDIAANYAGSFQTTVTAPQGWTVLLDSTGVVTAIPPSGIAPGDYTILVTAQAYEYPELALSAVHTVTIIPYEGLEVSLVPDPLLTVPMGDPPIAQVPDAAYTIFITNTSNAPYTYTLNVNGLPAGWALLSNANCCGNTPGATTTSLRLPAGGLGIVGLYVSPGTDGMPPAGTQYLINVLATSNTGLDAGDNAIFTMPAVPFTTISVQPDITAAAPNSLVNFEVTLQNVGNAPGTFTVYSTMPAADWSQVVPFDSPVTLDVGEVDHQAVAVQVGDATIGSQYRIDIFNPVPGSVYTQTASLNLIIFSETALGVQKAAEKAAGVCAISPTSSLPAALSFLGTSLNDLEASCQGGDCDQALKYRVVSALSALAGIVNTANPLLTVGPALSALSNTVAGHETKADLMDDIASAADLVGLLEGELCAIADHNLVATFSPGSPVALEDSSVDIALEVTNRGHLTTTGVFTLSLPGGLAASWTTEQLTLTPGETITIPTTIFTSDLGKYTLRADVAVLETPVVRYQATANLSVLDAFLRINQVIPSPKFIETGDGTPVTILIDLSNQTNLPMIGDGFVQFIASDGTVAASQNVPLQISSALVPLRLNLGAYDTASFASGIYTVTVDILDENGSVIPYASSYALLGVGMAIESSVEVFPAVVGPGTTVVTTTIETSLSQAILAQLGANRSGEGEVLATTDPLFVEAAEVFVHPAPAAPAIRVRPPSLVVPQPESQLESQPGSASTLETCDCEASGADCTCEEALAGSEAPAFTAPSEPVIAEIQTITAEPGVADPSASTVSVSTPHLADGAEAATIQITVMDAFTTPVEGAVVWLGATGTGGTFTPITGLTDVNGVFNATLTSTTPEVKYLSVFYGDGSTMFAHPATVPVDFTGASIQGSIFSDPDRDNIKDPGEEGLGGIGVSLYDVGTGTLVRATATGEGGVYTLTHLAAGTYRIEGAYLAEFEYSASSAITVTLAAFQNAAGRNFGLYAVGEAGGMVWNDLNQDGEPQFGEAPLEGALVSAYDSGMNLVDSQLTGQDGTFAFRLGASLPVGPQNFVFNSGPIPVFEPDEARFQNAGFSQVSTPLNPAFYPDNYDFELGDLGTWIGSSENVSVVSDTFNLDGYYLLINFRSTSATSPAFSVPPDATALVFDYYNWTLRNATETVPLTVYVLSGGDFSTVTNVGSFSSSANHEWQVGLVDMKAYRGQQIKVRFNSDTDVFRAGRARVDNVMLHDTTPGWSPSNARYARIVDDGFNLDGPHLYISTHNQTVQSAPVYIPHDAQSLRFDYYAYNAAGGDSSVPMTVFLLSGAEYAAQTTLGTFNGTLLHGWQTGVINIQPYRGEWVRFMFRSDTNQFTSGRLRLDNVTLSVDAPGWTPSDPRYVFVVDESVEVEAGVYAPANPDFSLVEQVLPDPAGLTNLGFSAYPSLLPPSEFPPNYDFSSGALDMGWTGSSADVGVISDTYNLDGYYLRLNNRNIYAETPTYVVPADARTLRFYYYGFTNRNAEETVPLTVFAMTGAAFEGLTQIGEFWGSRNQAWMMAELDISAFRGQTIKLRFRSDTDVFRAGRAFIDNIALLDDIPGWAVSDSRLVQVISDTFDVDGPYLRLNSRSQTATSGPFMVTAEMQSVQFSYFGWTTRNGSETVPLYVYALSGPDYNIRTSLGTFWGSFQNGWQIGVGNLAAFAGQSIQLQFATDTDVFRAGRARVDQISFLTRTPGWTINNARYISIEEADLPPDPDRDAPLNTDFSDGLTPFAPSLYPENYDFSEMRIPLAPAHYPPNYDFSSGDLGGWTTASASVSVVSDTYNTDGHYLLLNVRSVTVDSPAFQMHEDTQSVRFSYYNWTTRDASEQVPLTVYILSGHNFETVVNMGEVSGSDQDGWKEGRIDLSAYQGQVVKLRFASDTNVFRAGRARVDNISINIEVPGWDASDSRYVSIEDDTNSLSGPHLLMNLRAQYIQQAVYIPEGAHSLRFNYFAWTERNDAENVPVNIQVFHGADSGTVSTIGTFQGSRNSGWMQASADVSTLQGQTVLLRIATDTDVFRAGRARIDNLSLNVEVPDWHVSSGQHVQVGSAAPVDGNYLHINSNQNWAASAPFRLPEDVVAIRFDYTSWTNRNAAESTPLHLEVLSGDDFRIVTRIGTVNGSLNEGWKEGEIGISSFRGRVIQLRFASDTDVFRAGRAKVDNVSFVTGEPGPITWADERPEGPYLYLGTTFMHATSVPFYVGLGVTSVQFNYLNWEPSNGNLSIPLYVYVLYGENYNSSTLIGTLNSRWIDGWRTGTLDLTPFRGRMVQLRFASDTNQFRNGQAKVDQVVLLSTTEGSPTGTDSPPGGAFLYISRYGQQVSSSVISVPPGAPVLHFDYYNWSPSSATTSLPLTVRVLSGPDFSTVTTLATLNSRGLDGWRKAGLSLNAFAGQDIRLRFDSTTNQFSDGRNKLDNIYLSPFATEAYTITEINPVGYTSSTPDTVTVDVFGGANLPVFYGDYLFDRYLSGIEAAPTEVTADGVSTAVVTVTLRDGNGDPLAGYAVELLAVGNAIQIDQPPSVTDADGQAVGAIRSTFAPQVAQVTARTVQDHVTLAATIPVTFTPGAPDAGESSLVAAPASVIANGIDTAVFTATVRDVFGNLVSGADVIVTAASTDPVTVTQYQAVTDASGQLSGDVRSKQDQDVTLSAFLPIQGITITQTADIRFSRVDPEVSEVIVTNATLVADSTSEALLTVVLRATNGDVLPGRPVAIEVTGAGVTVHTGGSREMSELLTGLGMVPAGEIRHWTSDAIRALDSAIALGLTDANGVLTATVTASLPGIKTIQVYGDGIPLATQGVITFTVGPLDLGASSFETSHTSRIADGVQAATLTARIYDSYGHPIPGETVLIQADGTNLVLNQDVTETDGQGEVVATLTSTDVQEVTAWAYVPSDGVTLTQQVAIDFVTGPADLLASDYTITPTVVLADGIQTSSITATLRDVLNHPIANRQIQLVISGGTNTVTPSTLVVTDGDGNVSFTVSSSVVGTRNISLRDILYNVTLDLGILDFTAGPVNADASKLTANKTTVLIGLNDSSTITAQLYDSYNHTLPGKTVLIQVESTFPVTLTQNNLVTDGNGRVTAIIRSAEVQTATVSAFNQTDGVTITQQVVLNFIAGPPSLAKSSFGITPPFLIADNIQTALITATLRDEHNNPLKNRTVQLSVGGPGNRILPSIGQTTDENGAVTYSVASSRAGIKAVSIRDLSSGIVLPVGYVEFIAGSLDPGKSTFQAVPSRAAADGTSLVNLIVQATDALGNPIIGASVDILDIPFEMTLVQALALTDANGYAYASLASAVPGSAVLSASVDSLLLATTATVTFDPLLSFTSEVIPDTQTVPLGSAARYTIQVVNTGYLPESFTVEVTGLNPAWYTLSETEFHLPVGVIRDIQLVVLADSCLDTGTFPFEVSVYAVNLDETDTLPAQLTFVSEPILEGLLPHHGTSLGGTSALFTWRTAVSATTSLFIKPLTGTLYTEYPGAPGLNHQVMLDDLVRNTTYEWYAQSTSDCGTATSAPRELNILNGVVFTEREYKFTVERDYNQLVSIEVHNQDIISHTIVVTLENPADELILGFLGEGSIDDPFVLMPGESHTIELAIHTQDVIETDFTLTARLLATGGGEIIEDLASVNIHVHIPFFDFTLEQVDYDPVSLVGTYRVTNNGDPLTDLALTAVVSGTGQVYLMPSMTHGYLRSNQSFTFQAYPSLDSGFQEITGQIVATAGGIITHTGIHLALPPGTSMYLGTVENVTLESTTADWYCTNRPVIHNNFTLPPGFKRADVDNAMFYMNINADRSLKKVLPHDVELLINDNSIGKMINIIPTGLYSFPINPDYFNEALVGPSTNRITVKTTHLNGGHYVVASDMTVSICMNVYREWVAAASQEEADTIVASRTFLIEAPSTLEVEVLSPASGENLTVGLPVELKIRILDDATSQLFYTVIAEADNDNGTVMLFDDGRHNDGLYKDGVYAGVWTPVNPGLTTLTISAASCSITGGTVISFTVGTLAHEVQISHGVPSPGTELLTGTISPPALVTVELERTQLDWEHTLDISTTHVLDTFALNLPDMTPGEVRQVSDGTQVAYTGMGGSGLLSFPPLYVTAGHIIEIKPPVQSANLGGAARYDVTLVNPGSTADTYTLTLSGIPMDWVTELSTIPLHRAGGTLTLAAGISVTVPLTVHVPSNADLGEVLFSIAVTNQAGGNDLAGAVVLVHESLSLEISPDLRTVPAGGTAAYDVILTNHDTQDHEYDLTLTGLEGSLVSLAGSVEVTAGGRVTVPLEIVAYSPGGAHAFAVRADQVGSSSFGGAVSRSADAILFIDGEHRLGLVLSPESAEGGPGVPLAYTLTVSNLGSLADTYTFTVEVPVGWAYGLYASALDTQVDSVTLQPALFNTTNLQLVITPPAGTSPGDYPFEVTAYSGANPNAVASVIGEYVVGNLGVGVSLNPVSKSIVGTSATTWQVTVTNLGTVADTYDLYASGVVGLLGQFSPSSITLNPGQSGQVTLTANYFVFVSPGTYFFEVAARSRADANISSTASGTLTLTGFYGVEAELTPGSQSVSEMRGFMTLVITNTGTLDAWYNIEVFAPGGEPPLVLNYRLYLPLIFSGGGGGNPPPPPLAEQFIAVAAKIGQVYIPAGATARVPVYVLVGDAGSYLIQAEVTTAASLKAETEAEFNVFRGYPFTLYLPLIVR